MQNGYTVGLKRRFWPGSSKVKVTRHSWENFRFILDLADGSQELVPGFSCRGLKVYPDFWAYMAFLKSQDRPAREPAPLEIKKEFSGVTNQDVPRETQTVVAEEARPYVSPEVMQRATLRVRGILSESMDA